MNSFIYFFFYFFLYGYFGKISEQIAFLPLLCYSQSTKAVYDRIIDLRIATPQIIINYAMFLEEHNYFEESFKVIRYSNFTYAHRCYPVKAILNPRHFQHFHFFFFLM